MNILERHPKRSEAPPVTPRRSVRHRFSPRAQVLSIGTWTQGTAENATAIVAEWLAQGGRGIDTAYIYFDQDKARRLSPRLAGRAVWTPSGECVEYVLA